MSTFPRPLTKQSRRVWLILFATALVCSGALFLINRSAQSKKTSAITKLPPIIVWAWERPEQLQYVDPARIGVAFLATTIYLRGEEVVVRPRFQPLNVPADTSMIAVVRIESDRSERPHLTGQQLNEAASAVSKLAQLPRVVAVQIDFDATLTERNFYRELLTQVRQRLPVETALSMTALASWCKGDNWLDDLPVDEAVPMLFRLGVQKHQIREQLVSGEQFTSKKCQTSVGLSIDEPIPGLEVDKRRYFFNPRSWTESSVNELLK